MLKSVYLRLIYNQQAEDSISEANNYSYQTSLSEIDSYRYRNNENERCINSNSEYSKSEFKYCNVNIQPRPPNLASLIIDILRIHANIQSVEVLTFEDNEVPYSHPLNNKLFTDIQETRDFLYPLICLMSLAFVIKVLKLKN